MGYLKQITESLYNIVVQKYIQLFETPPSSEFYLLTDDRSKYSDIFLYVSDTWGPSLRK